MDLSRTPPRPGRVAPQQVGVWEPVGRTGTKTATWEGGRIERGQLPSRRKTAEAVESLMEGQERTQSKDSAQRTHKPNPSPGGHPCTQGRSKKVRKPPRKGTRDLQEGSLWSWLSPRPGPHQPVEGESENPEAEDTTEERPPEKETS